MTPEALARDLTGAFPVVRVPRRIQRSRAKGWRMPDGAVYVGRPGRFGNPFFLGRVGDMRRWTGWYVGEVGDLGVSHGDYTTKAEAAARAVDLFRAWLHGRPELVEQARRDLAGRDLACWCPLPAPGEPDHCHAAALLSLANGGQP